MKYIFQKKVESITIPMSHGEDKVIDNTRMVKATDELVSDIVKNGSPVVFNFATGKTIVEVTPNDKPNGTAVATGLRAALKSTNKIEFMSKGNKLNSKLNEAVVLAAGYSETASTYYDSNTDNLAEMRKEYNKNPNVNDKNIKSDVSVPKEIVDSFLMKFVTDENGQKIDAEKAATQLSKVTMVAYSATSTAAALTNNIMKSRMADVGYSEKETSEIMSNALVVAIAPVTKLYDEHQLEFKTLAVAAVNDKLVNQYDKDFEKRVEGKLGEKVNGRSEKDFAIMEEENKNMVTLLVENSRNVQIYRSNGEKSYLHDPDQHAMKAYVNFKVSESNLGAAAIMNVIRNRIDPDVNEKKDLVDLLVREKDKPFNEADKNSQKESEHSPEYIASVPDTKMTMLLIKEVAAHKNQQQHS